MAVSRWAIIAFVIVSALGFLDATFLAVKFYTGGPIPCSITGGCERVTTSAYAAISGIPVALLGAIYYLALFLAGVHFISKAHRRLFFFLTRATAVGFIASIWFVYVQVFILQSLCLYCLFSAGSSTILFLLAVFMIGYSRPDQRSVSTQEA